MCNSRFSRNMNRRGKGGQGASLNGRKTRNQRGAHVWLTQSVSEEIFVQGHPPPPTPNVTGTTRAQVLAIACHCFGAHWSPTGRPPHSRWPPLFAQTVPACPPTVPSCLPWDHLPFSFKQMTPDLSPWPTLKVQVWGNIMYTATSTTSRHDPWLLLFYF